MPLDWSFDELQSHIDIIASGEKVVFIDPSTSNGSFYLLLTYPTKFELQLSDIEHDKTLRQAQKDNFLSEDQILDNLRERGVWTDQDEKRIEQFRAQIKIRRDKFKTGELQEDRISYLQEAITKFEEEIRKIEDKKDQHLQFSAERKARQNKYDWLAWKCSKSVETRENYWDNYLTYYQSVNGEIKGRLLTELLRFLGGHTAEEIRYIARSNLWRINYISATKANNPLFNRAVTEFTPDQLNLVWWSSYYQSIYEMLPEDQPTDDVIGKDDELDKFMDNLYKERQQERAARRDTKRRGANSAMNMQEVLVMRSHPDYEDLKYDKPPTSRETSKTLSDDPQMKGRFKKLAMGKTKTKRFTGED